MYQAFAKKLVKSSMLSQAFVNTIWILSTCMDDVHLYGWYPLVWMMSTCMDDVHLYGYCPLVWTMHSRWLNNRIKRIHERALRIVYNDQFSSFDERDGSLTIHVWNLQTLATEVYKVINGIAPTIKNEIFQLKDNSKYRSRFPFKTQCKYCT